VGVRHTQAVHHADGGGGSSEGHKVRVERREQYSVDNRVVPPDAVVLGDLSHQLVCRRVVPATEQRFQSITTVVYKNLLDCLPELDRPP
jgi:hypothetical protein